MICNLCLESKITMITKFRWILTYAPSVIKISIVVAITDGLFKALIHYRLPFKGF